MKQQHVVSLLASIFIILGVVFLLLLLIGDFEPDLSNVQGNAHQSTLAALAEIVQWAVIHVLIPLIFSIAWFGYVYQTKLPRFLAVTQHVLITTALCAIWEPPEKSIGVYYGLYNDNIDPTNGNYMEERTVDINGDLANAFTAGIVAATVMLFPGYKLRSMFPLWVRRTSAETVLYIVLWIAVGLGTFIGVLESRWGGVFVYRGGFAAASCFEVALLLFINVLDTKAAARSEILWDPLITTWGKMIHIDCPQITQYDVNVTTIHMLLASVVYRASLIFPGTYSYVSAYVASMLYIVIAAFIRLGLPYSDDDDVVVSKEEEEDDI